MVFQYVKWFHVVTIISWMAGLLYLFRLFVYHQERGSQADVHTLLAHAERRLYRIIALPAMLMAWVSGLAMIHLTPQLMGGKWLHWKLLCVLVLSGITGLGGSLVRKFSRHPEQPVKLSSRTLRLLNELPALLMIVVVGLVILKPF